jgi:hypothetical protein
LSGKNGNNMKKLGGKFLILKQSLTLVEVEDSGALLDTEKKCCYDLNPTAYFLLKLIEDGCYPESLQAELISKFDIDEETARYDIDTFVDKLINVDCIRITKAENEYPATVQAKKGNTLYETPAIEYNSELAVACAPTAF